jgi:hypothetical protein
MLLLADSARDTDGMRVLHRKMTDNYRKWAAHMKVAAQCAGDSDIAQNKVPNAAHSPPTPHPSPHPTPCVNLPAHMKVSA